ncbi:acyl-ACP--UDP-N-acetylglucosamine O-acyltransferase [Macellibacteroides fermentans]|uniref:Acyl-[acyl-carrier-protein]--UDP-N-acetylglucosamine O-acyltransferase n=1 Tax=Parabacteroides chartae TaxID=1037355 RepID=A0A1T5DY20_9BACT|nr:acyl-ACP--UDP-N-acetylglucosamine O-acyltransferase [Parabacteroides chartae]SKB76722.1 acyl-[acyl-carrier-protein]--UDP-N-acetylglucosamine O-acyltransferase [Parabacteroides chartae]
MNNTISPLAFVSPDAKLGEGVTIHPFAYVDKDVVIGNNCTIMPYASVLSGTRMGNGNQVYQGAVLGATPQDFTFHGDESFLEIGNDNVFREGVLVSRSSHAGGKTVIGNKNFLMEGVHVCHDSRIADHCVLGIKTLVSGNCIIDSHAILSSMVIMFQDTHVGEWSMVRGGARFKKDVPPFVVTTANPTSYYGVNVKVLEYNKFPEKVIKHIAHAYEIIYHAKVSVTDALIRVEEEVPMSDEIRSLVKFIRSSEKGIV